MAITHAQPGDLIQLQPQDGSPSSQTSTLLKSDCVQLIRLVIAAGKEIPEHRAPGELLIQCLAGEISVTGDGKTNQLQVGQAVYFRPHAPHSVKGIKDGILLLTLFLAEDEASNEVDEASRESFPASDPPAWSG